jgi:hypothetical protein
VSEITHPLGGVISTPTSKPLIVVAFDRSTPSAQGLPLDEFTRKFTPPIFVDVGRVIGRQKSPTGRELTTVLAMRARQLVGESAVGMRRRRRSLNGFQGEK